MHSLITFFKEFLLALHYGIPLKAKEPRLGLFCFSLLFCGDKRCETALGAVCGVLFDDTGLCRLVEFLEDSWEQFRCLIGLLCSGELAEGFDGLFHFRALRLVFGVTSLVLAKRLFGCTCNWHGFSNLQFLIYNFQVEARKVSWYRLTVLG